MKFLYALAFLSATASAHCPNYSKVRWTETCRAYTEPELAKVYFDEKSREFQYALGYREITTSVLDTYNCWGRFLYSHTDRRERPGVVPFAQPEAGHADFTLVREVRAYLDRAGDACR